MKINGTTFPDPSEMKISLMHVDNAERNVNALMLIDAIALKRKLEMKWKYLSRANTASLMAVVTSLSNRFVTIEYTDPATGALRTGTFYTSDKEFSTGHITAGLADYFKDISFNAIEQ